MGRPRGGSELTLSAGEEGCGYARLSQRCAVLRVSQADELRCAVDGAAHFGALVVLYGGAVDADDVSRLQLGQQGGVWTEEVEDQRSQRRSGGGGVHQQHRQLPVLLTRTHWTHPTHHPVHIGHARRMRALQRSVHIDGSTRDRRRLRIASQRHSLTSAGERVGGGQRGSLMSRRRVVVRVVLVVVVGRRWW